MKILKLDHQFAQQVLSGERRSTWRMFDEKHLSVGDEIQIVDKVDPDDDGTWLIIGEGKIEQVTEKRLADVSENEYKTEEAYTSLDDILAEFRKFYGPLVTSATPVKIVKFSFVPNSEKQTNDVAKATKYTEVKLFTDGGSRGNPGPSALGFVIMDTSDNIILSGSKYLGITTNNQAEYQAVKAGLEACSKITDNTVDVYLDSQLVAHQMNGIYKIKNRELWPIHQSIKQIAAQQFSKVTFTYVPRELNKDADAMVNKALDEFEDNI
jgi:ribonuclease HI